MKILAIEHTERSGVKPEWDEKRWMQYIKEEYEKAKFNSLLADMRICLAGDSANSTTVNYVKSTKPSDRTKEILRQLSHRSVI